MRNEFEFSAPVKIVAGVGAAGDIKHWAEVFEAKHILVITGKHVSQSPAFLAMTGKMEEDQLFFEVYNKTVPEPPMGVVDKLANYMRKQDFDLVLAVGGGSPMDTAKAVCMLKNNPGEIKEYLFGGTKTPQVPSVPLICIPTTAGSGSEVSAASVIEDTDRNVKLSCTHPNMLAKVAILDPQMQVDMPLHITAETGMDAMTHAIEAYTSKNATTFSDMYAKEAIAIIGKYLPKVVKEPGNLEYRMKMAQASSMAAIAFLNGGLGAVHGISQATGGVAHTAHGVTNAILLPKVMQYNYKGNLNKFANIANLLGINTFGMNMEEAAGASVTAIKELNQKIKIPNTLADIGVTPDMRPQIIEGTMGYRMLWMNPITITEEIVAEILQEGI